MFDIILKIYLKNIKKPVAIVTLDSDKHLAEFYEQINDTTKVVVRFGPLSFNREEFKYATEERKRRRNIIPRAY